MYMSITSDLFFTDRVQKYTIVIKNEKYSSIRIRPIIIVKYLFKTHLVYDIILITLK